MKSSGRVGREQSSTSSMTTSKSPGPPISDCSNRTSNPNLIKEEDYSIVVLSKSGCTTNLYLPFGKVTGPRELAYFPSLDLATCIPPSNKSWVEYIVMNKSSLPENSETVA